MDRGENGNGREGKLDAPARILDRKFWVAMALFAVLAALAWFTMGGVRCSFMAGRWT